jgi:dTDP-4-dehydrorhamnose reductase
VKRLDAVQTGPVAVVGAGGVLGVKLVQQLVARSAAEIYAFTHKPIVPAIPEAGAPRVRWAPLDIADKAAVDTAMDAIKPALVINSAAMTNVDACEARREEALAVNGRGPRHLAEACVRLGAALVHVSTDYVFPGDDDQPGPYTEEAMVRPVNHYGWTKLLGEQAVEEVCVGRVPWLIARTALVYGQIPGGRTNFVTWLAGELRAGRRVRVVHDQVNTPTYADDLAAVLVHLAERGSEGYVHVAGPDLLTREQWARVTAQHYHLDEGLIEVVSTAELHQPARRPLRSGLRSNRADEWAGVTLRGVRDGLEALAP